MHALHAFLSTHQNGLGPSTGSRGARLQVRGTLTRLAVSLPRRMCGRVVTVTHIHIRLSHLVTFATFIFIFWPIFLCWLWGWYR